MTSNLTRFLFARKPVDINVSRSAAPKLALVPLFSQKSVNINVSLSAPKPALVAASRYYCDVNWSYHNVCAKIH